MPSAMQAPNLPRITSYMVNRDSEEASLKLHLFGIILEVPQGAKHKHNKVRVQRHAEQFFPIVKCLHLLSKSKKKKYLVERATAISERAREGLPAAAHK